MPWMGSSVGSLATSVVATGGDEHIPGRASLIELAAGSQGACFQKRGHQKDPKSGGPPSGVEIWVGAGSGRATDAMLRVACRGQLKDALLRLPVSRFLFLRQEGLDLISINCASDFHDIWKW